MNGAQSCDAPGPPVALVLESDREWRSVLGSEMVRLGYLVLPVQSAEEALDHVRHLPAGTILVVGRLRRVGDREGLLSRLAEINPSMGVVALADTAPPLAEEDGERHWQMSRGLRELRAALAHVEAARHSL